MDDLKFIRKARGMKQFELAALSGISTTEISNIETGKNCPSRSTRERIEAVLGRLDWIETHGLDLRKAGDFRQAERLLQRLVSTIHGLTENEKTEILKLTSKYLKK